MELGHLLNRSGLTCPEASSKALPVLLYGSETWTIKARDARITAAEMKYMRRTAGYILTDYKTNIQIAKEKKNNSNFGQMTGIQEKLDTTCK
jgi:hypothetical protein